MLRKILGQQTPGGKDVFSGPLKGPTPPPKFPDDRSGERCSFRRSCSEPPHVWRVVWFWPGIWRIWTLIGGTGGFGRQSGPQNNPCVLFYPFTTPPKKK